MATYVHDNSFATRRLTVLAAIVALHVFLAWALATGLAHRVVQAITEPLKTNIIDEVKPEDLPPPPPPPEMERPPVEVPPPEVSIELPFEPATTAITDVTDKPAPMAPPPPPPPKAVRVGARIKNAPNTEDYYPPSSKRLEEQGTAVVRVCVGPNGKPAETPTIQTSSGFPKLDEGAIKLAKATRYIAGSENGQPMTDCLSFKVKFEIKG